MKHLLLLAFGLALTAGTLAHGKPFLLFDDLENPAWKPDTQVAYKHAGGIDLPMAIFLPKDRARLAERRPAILLIHGGGWAAYRGGDWRQWDPGVFAIHARYFARRGAVGVVFDYRNHENKSAESASLFDQLADCRSAIRFLRAHAADYGIDPGRIAAMGYSAGGHLAAALGTIDAFDNPGDDTTVSGLANATIPCNAIMDLTDPKWSANVPEQPCAWEQVPLTREERAKRISPLFNVTAKSAPSLVMHGLSDNVVAPEHSMKFHQAMRAAGARCELLTLPTAKHAFILPGYSGGYVNWITAMRAADAFLTSLGYLHGESPLAALPPVVKKRRLTAHWAFTTPLVNGVCPSENGQFRLAVPAGEMVDDVERGKALKVATGRDGLRGDCRGADVTATVSLWLNPTVLGGTLVSRTGGQGSDIWGYTLTLAMDGTLRLKVGEARADQAADTPGVPAGRWSHIVVSIGRARAAIHLDDKPVAVAQYPPTSLAGNRLCVAANYVGLISDLRVYEGAEQ